MQIEGLDELDNKILTAIDKNARLSFSEIGEMVGLSRVSVKNRMAALERRGVILGYYTKINADNALEGTRFFVEVVTQPDQFEQVVDRIACRNIIRRVYAVTGECKLMAEGFAPDRSKYETFMRNLKHNLNGVKSITVMDAQYVIKNTYGGVDYVTLEERAHKDATENGEEQAH